VLEVARTDIYAFGYYDYVSAREWIVTGDFMRVSHRGEQRLLDDYLIPGIAIVGPRYRP